MELAQTNEKVLTTTSLQTNLFLNIQLFSTCILVYIRVRASARVCDYTFVYVRVCLHVHVCERMKSHICNKKFVVIVSRD